MNWHSCYLFCLIILNSSNPLASIPLFASFTTHPLTAPQTNKFSNPLPIATLLLTLKPYSHVLFIHPPTYHSPSNPSLHLQSVTQSLTHCLTSPTLLHLPNPYFL